jgi:hypothetical protein
LTALGLTSRLPLAALLRSAWFGLGLGFGFGFGLGFGLGFRLGYGVRLLRPACPLVLCSRAKALRAASSPAISARSIKG